MTKEWASYAQVSQLDLNSDLDPNEPFYGLSDESEQERWEKLYSQPGLGEENFETQEELLISVPDEQVLLQDLEDLGLSENE